MMFEITRVPGQAGDKSGEVMRVHHTSGMSAEVWPFLGLNCLRWSISEGPILYTAPDWSTNPVPTRSGHPVLFPFPNRLKGGRFEFEGRGYQLPLNDASKSHAIHGFSPRNPWRLIKTEATASHAEVTGEFRLSVDVPELAGFWPGDLTLTLTYRFTSLSLTVSTTVKNPSSQPVPFGLGFHPYFQLPDVAGEPVDEYILEAKTPFLWPALESLATGEKVPCPPELDFTAPRPIGSLALDHLYGDVPPHTPVVVKHPKSQWKLEVRSSPEFRELLLFTPPHRQALAIEPYTCTTDAANFSARGIDAGWRVLAPGAEFLTMVEYSLSRS
jgi:aldose 1-epimerase